jgi:hypothetical protein
MIGGPSAVTAQPGSLPLRHFDPQRLPYNLNNTDGLEKRLETGQLDLEKLQKQLDKRFGGKAAGVIGEDGTVDFEKIAALVQAEHTARLKEQLESHYGAAAEGIVGEDGSVDREKLHDLVLDRHVSRLQEMDQAGTLDKANFLARLEDRFGSEAKGVTDENGTIDYGALRDLLDNKEPFFMLIGGPFTAGGGNIAYMLPKPQLIDFEA